MKHEQKALAQRYAQALFELCSQEKTVETVGAQLQQFADLLESSTELNTVFCSPGFDPEQRKKVVKEISDKGSYNIHTKNFLLLLLDKKRSSLLPQIQTSFKELSDLQAKRLHVTVTTAAEPTADFLKQLEDKLGGQSNQSIVIHHSVDSNLLGGPIIQVGDRMLDGSIRAQLTSMKEQLLQQV